MQWFEYARPGTVGEAVRLLSEHGEKACVLAGGTDILVQLRGGFRTAEWVIDVKEIPALDEIAWDEASGLTIGAAAPCYRIYENEDVKKHYPGLIDAASLIGGTQIQGRASLGGNLCNAAPSADAVPIMIALEASCCIAGPNGERTVAVEDFCTAPGKNVLAAGELLVSLHFPAPKANSGAHYLRFIPRNEMDIAVAGAGVSVVLANGNFASARVALASVAPTPLFVKQAGDALAGQPVNDESIQRAADIAKQAAKPIDDMRGTVRYRKHLCEVLTRRALHVAVERARRNN
ncbi:MAG: xanthine dehydrogenase family protein subunit M [Bryobacterales bacterium]|nr:xanthine dehydrogenase family protein subunit M [Bryobacterales bacterium]MDE0292848.1 xanthine dehydrogenase family protein subunit M [Bryobacterales bacterium]MDE0433918.1 xanthine dehydrogenase family protein subunit M [Bryobacterales bacterium]